jgi:hypothetical protein
MKSAGEIGMKITAAEREYFRYTSVSAKVERRGMGSSRPELAWTKRQEQDDEQKLAGTNAATRQK